MAIDPQNPNFFEGEPGKFAGGLTAAGIANATGPQGENGAFADVNDPAREQAALAASFARGSNLGDPNYKPPSQLAQTFANAGLVTSAQPTLDSMAQENQTAEAALKAQSDARLAQLRGQIETQFGTKIAEQQKLGEKQLGGVKAQLGGSRGLGFSSSRQDYINQMQKENEDIIKGYEQAKAEALMKADFASADQYAQQVQQQREYSLKLRKQALEEKQQVFDQAQKTLESGRADKTLALNQQKANNPIEVSPGASIYDPATGKFIGTAPQKPADEKPVTQEVGGVLFQYDPTATDANGQKGIWRKVAEGAEAKLALVQKYEYAKTQGYTGSFTDYQNEDANRNQKAASITAGGLNSVQQTAAFKLVDDYEKASGDFPKQVGAYNRILASAKNPSPAGDLALLYNYMKLLDPGSTVREGEFATASNAGSIPERIWAQYNKAISGTRLTEPQRKDFVDRSGNIYQSAADQQKKVDDTFKERAQKFGIPPEFVIRDQSSFTKKENQKLQSGYESLKFDIPYDQALEKYGEEGLQKILESQGIHFDKPLSMGVNGSVQIPESSRLAYVNNNPGNLRFAGQAGATQGDGGFARFSTPEAGFRALQNQIRLDAGRGLTLDKFINKYAPPTENNTSQYLTQVASRLGVDPDEPLTSLDLNELAKEIAKKESSSIIA